MGYALKVVSVCPKDLIDPYSHVHFGSRLGIVLADTHSIKPENETSWSQTPLSQDELSRLREVYDFLERRDALVTYKFNADALQNASIYEMVCHELSAKNSLMQLAICSDPPTPIPIELHDKILSSKDAVLNYSFVQSHIDVKMHPSFLCEAMTPILFDGTRFKIIDPYIFEMGEGQAQSRIEFILELCRQLDIHNSFDHEEVEIEIYGRAYSYPKGKYKKLTEEDLKSTLEETTDLREVSDKYNIKFIGLKEKQNGERLHLRCLYTSKFIIGIEDSFQERYERDERSLKTQKIWFGSEYKPWEVDNMYKENTDEFICKFSFYADEIWD